MKKKLSLTLLIISTVCLSQNKTATTEDGKKVLLKSDKTWEYTEQANTTDSDCNLGPDFKEAKANERLRKHVAVENDCKLEDVKFISSTQGRGNGMYSLCVKGKIMKYKLIGTVFMRAEQSPF